MTEPAAVIEVPDWATKLCNVLETKSAIDRLAARIASGEIKPDASLHYDLGVSPQELASLAYKINTDVINNFSKANPRRHVTTAELQACKKFVDLMNLVFDRLGL